LQGGLKDCTVVHKVRPCKPKACRVVQRLAGSAKGLHGRSKACRVGQRLAQSFKSLHGRSKACTVGQRLARSAKGLHGRSKACTVGQRLAQSAKGLHGRSKACTVGQKLARYVGSWRENPSKSITCLRGEVMCFCAAPPSVCQPQLSKAMSRVCGLTRVPACHRRACECVCGTSLGATACGAPQRATVAHLDVPQPVALRNAPPRHSQMCQRTVAAEAMPPRRRAGL